MVQVNLAPVQDGAHELLLLAKVPGAKVEGNERADAKTQDQNPAGARKLSRSSESGAGSSYQASNLVSSGSSSSSGSLLVSSRRSSSIVCAIDMPLSGVQNCDSNMLENRAKSNHVNTSQQLIRSSSASNCFIQINGQNRPGGFDEIRANHGGSQDKFGQKAAAPSKLKSSPDAGNKLGRTISRSMLELDASVGENERFLVYWKNLTFRYEPSWMGRLLAKATGSEQRSLTVLNDLSGSIRSNELVAIIGPSGCGKTTLLQFLAGNNAHHQDRMRIRGITAPKVAFIGQDDGLLPGLTARETLIYASRLQNSAPNFDHQAHIQPILSELGLAECADRDVSKLSGGQAKRVVIAQELLYPTNLLILDEVTSGLDASTSYSIVKLLKYLVSDCSYPMSIVMSIHQPSARLFSVFDQVYLMSDGCCLYEGSCNLDEINQHLHKFQLECPKFHNIADYLIELACCTSDDILNLTSRLENGGNGAREDHDGAKMISRKATGKSVRAPASLIKEQMVEYKRRQSEMGQFDLMLELPAEAGKLETKNESLEASLLLASSSPDSSLYQAIDGARQGRMKPFLNQLAIHFSRSLMRIRRSYILTWLQLTTYVILGLQLSTFYGPEIGRLSGCPRMPPNMMSYILAPGGEHEHNNDEANSEDLNSEMRRVQENMNFLLVTVMTTTFAALEITVITFPMEAKTIKREWRNGWYRVSSYFMGRTLADLPFQLIFVLIFCLLVYVLTGQIGLGTWRFGSFVLTVMMTAFVAQSFGFMFGAIFMDNLPAAVFTAPLAIFPTLLFSGFFSRVSQVPSFYRPFTYLSHFRYAFDALLITLYGYNRCDCDQETLTGYHASLANQTSQMRDVFNLLFGASDCLHAAAQGGNEPETTTATTAAATTRMETNLLAMGGDDENTSHEDLAAIQAGNSSLAAQLISMIRNSTPASSGAVASTLGTTPVPVHRAAESFKQLEDMLVESAFQQMSALAPNGGRGEIHGESNFSDLAISANGTTALENMTPMDRLATRFSGKLTGMLSRQSNFGHPMPTQCAKFNSYLLTEFNLADDNLWFGLLMLLVSVVITRLLCNLILHRTIASRAR